jgi:hypothetical protein
MVTATRKSGPRLQPEKNYLCKGDWERTIKEVLLHKFLKICIGQAKVEHIPLAGWDKLFCTLTSGFARIIADQSENRKIWVQQGKLLRLTTIKKVLSARRRRPRLSCPILGTSAANLVCFCPNFL